MLLLINSLLLIGIYTVFKQGFSDSFTILGLWVLGLAVSHINESQLQTYESRTLFLMTSLQYYCILGLAEIKTLHPREKICAKDAGCAGNKIAEDLALNVPIMTAADNKLHNLS